MNIHVLRSLDIIIIRYCWSFWEVGNSVRGNEGYSEDEGNIFTLDKLKNTAKYLKTFEFSVGSKDHLNRTLQLYSVDSVSLYCGLYTCIRTVYSYILIGSLLLPKRFSLPLHFHSFFFSLHDLRTFTIGSCKQITILFRFKSLSHNITVSIYVGCTISHGSRENEIFRGNSTSAGCKRWKI